MAIFCLLFIVIGGVSASDVADMSNNPDKNNLVSASIDSGSDKSVANHYTNQLSSEATSSLNSQSTEDNNLETTNEASDLKSVSNSNSNSMLSTNPSSNSSQNNNITSTKTTTKTTTSLKLSSSKIYSGTPILITLKDKKGKVLSGKKIIIKIPSKNRVFTKITNSKGQVRLNYHKIGTFKTYVSFKGDGFFKSSKFSLKIKVLKSGTRLKVSNTTVPRSTSLVVNLINKKSGSGIAKKRVIFKIPKWNNKTYVRTTNSKGQAKLVVTTKKNFSVLISFEGSKNLYKSKIKTKVKPIKCKTKFIYPSTYLEYGENFVVSLKKVNNEPVKNKKVIVKITNMNKTYIKKTNSKGQFNVPINHIGTLNTKISFAGDSLFVKSSSNPILTVVKGGTRLEGSDTTVGKGFNYDINLKNSAGKVLANRKVKITLNNQTFTETTNSKGQVSLLMNYKTGLYPIEVDFSGNAYYNSSRLTETIKVVDPSVSISKIISAAKDLKVRVEYVNMLNKAYNVNIDNKKYTMDEFAYLMAGALTNINSGSKDNVKIKDLSNNYNSSGAKINGKLSKSEYLKLAKNLTAFVDSNNRIPNYKLTNIGKMEANLYIYAFAAALDYYGSHKKLPSSVTVKTSYVSGGYSISLSQSGKILNYREIFDSDAFAKYLKTGGKSALNDAIKKKAKSLTSGLSSTKAKANAIFEFARDDVSYSFYMNSKKGAAKTLSSRSANCCDKANLIVAMCRSVGIYARYSHAKGCHFSSGLVAGHVWAQVYDPISQTWYTADSTSRRNKLGTINNWNTKSYSIPKNYVFIPF
ncbi:Pseudomurein-binding repeat-containing protein [Methanobrevibacter olleyae]|uniref:Pseudomurein-binding repeat-containing protein n=1 Tax=Methanobrevibacter olleyae TaxID=294671 RepID=A0A1I4JF01_METOL|nr:transglutaminase domain-containing protein [Methanobrevibacter olleyae]SFL65142.1 Pseudomurein-binding repeat-containing protein [Methanobrevibacter olleyae]